MQKSFILFIILIIVITIAAISENNIDPKQNAPLIAQTTQNN